MPPVPDTLVLERRRDLAGRPLVRARQQQVASPAEIAWAVLETSGESSTVAKR
jgi:uncharacterized membrane protein YcaP (DUF421 family)